MNYSKKILIFENIKRLPVVVGLPTGGFVLTAFLTSMMSSFLGNIATGLKNRKEEMHMTRTSNIGLTIVEVLTLVITAVGTSALGNVLLIK